MKMFKVVVTKKDGTKVSKVVPTFEAALVTKVIDGYEFQFENGATLEDVGEEWIEKYRSEMEETGVFVLWNYEIYGDSIDLDDDVFAIEIMPE